MAAPTSFPSTDSKGALLLPTTSIDASFFFDTVTAISMPIKEQPTTTSFFPSLAAGETVSTCCMTRGCNQRNLTCVNLGRIIDASESGNVFEVDAGDGELLGLTSRGKDEFVIANEFFASFQNDLLSGNVDRGDGLTICASFRHGVMRELRCFTYSAGAQRNAKLYPQVGSGPPFHL